MNKYFSDAINMLYPENIYCICCGDVMNSRPEGLCDKCIGEITWLSKNPFDSKTEGFFFDEVISLAAYDYKTKEIVHSLKLRQQTYIARNLGRMMGEIFKANHNGDYIMMPVPMHKEKEKLRGFNQSDLLGKYASKSAGITYIKDGLIKIKETNSMRLAGAEQRKRMLEGSIVVNPARASQIYGRNIVLTDDVVTTGTTANTCAKVLKEAGVLSVSILSFAVVNYK